MASVQRPPVRRRPSRGLWWEFLYGLIIPDYDEAIPHDEVIFYSERRHLIWWLRATWGPFVLLVLGAVVLFYTDESVVASVAAVVMISALFYIFWKSIEWAVLVLVVTERRLLEVGGVFSLSIGVLPLTKLTDLKYDQTFLGRLFSYGAVRVETAGQNQALSTISDIRLPLQFFQAISNPGPQIDPFDD